MFHPDNQTKTLYTGTKNLYAWPMTRGEYNEYRGWKTPANEDSGEEGYLVEYTDGKSKPNHENHVGYVSWSPASVFDSAYKPANQVKKKINGNLREQLIKEVALRATAYLGTPTFTPAELAERVNEFIDNLNQ